METLSVMYHKSAYNGPAYFNDGHIVIQEKDIYINPDFTEIRIRYNANLKDRIPYYERPIPGHVYHIFLNKMTASIVNGSLQWYIEWIHEMTNQKVYVHIPKGYENLHRIENALRNTDGCVIIKNKKDYKFVFANQHGPRCLCLITWCEKKGIQYHMFCVDKDRRESFP